MSEAAVQAEWVLAEAMALPAGDAAPVGNAKGAPRLKAVDRKQLMLRPVDVEQLIEEDRPARAIWAFTGRMDGRRFPASIQAVEGVAGREAWDPRLLASLWIYACSRGIGSATAYEALRSRLTSASPRLYGGQPARRNTAARHERSDIVKRKARVGMVGLRGYGNIIRRGLKECANVELAAIWSRDPESVARSQAELPSKVCGSYEALLREPLDGVIIANPNYLHLEYGLKAAEAGKSILVEKPMTNTVAEAKLLIEAFEAKGLLLAVKHLHRYGPENRQIGDWIAGGELGRVLSMETYTSHSSSKSFPPDRWKRDPEKCPAAPLTQLGVHYIDTAMSFFGHPVWAESVQRNVLRLSDNIDCSVTTIAFGEIPATFHAHYVVPSYQRLAVYGTEAIAIADPSGLYLKREGQNDFTAVKPSRPDALVQVLTEYADSLLNGTPFETPGGQSIYVVAAAEAAIRSAAENSRRVSIDELLGQA